jgi:capsular polysaccharide transport system ATP-binding protein
MISMNNVSKVYPSQHGPVTVLDSINFEIRSGEHVGILGRNGAGKSTMIRLISGAEQPTRGSVTRGMSVSWPLAFGGAFQGTLTGMDNYRFICRIYGADPKAGAEFIESFSELGEYLNEPVRTYSSGMRARLAFAISMAVEFDCFLIDEIIAVGDVRFHQKCYTELFEKRSSRAMIIVSHDAQFVKARCDRATVLSNGKLLNFDTVDQAYDYYLDFSQG